MEMFNYLSTEYDIKFIVSVWPAAIKIETGHFYATLFGFGDIIGRAFNSIVFDRQFFEISRKHFSVATADIQKALRL